MQTPTLKDVAEAIERAHNYCSYYPSTNETLGPYNVHDLDGPSTGCYYDHRRTWNTRIAVALAQEEFHVSLSNYDIVNYGPWRDTVRSIHNAIAAEINAEDEYIDELLKG